ncbi:MAG: hypothetical protein M3015_11895 [Bacteroidota bacterium]|nr:hypothetical protein [Bacteroidota bacterium]
MYDERSKLIINKIHKWIIAAITAVPRNISSGYALNGNAYAKRNDEKYFDAMSFMAPLCSCSNGC